MAKRSDQCPLDGAETAWVLRAGVRGAADRYFEKDDLIVLESQGLGDLTKIAPKREAFYRAYRSTKKDETRTAVAGIGGKFFRFAHEMKIGDFVIYPALKTREVWCGRIMSDYRYDRGNREYPHQRDVRWIAKIHKGELSQAAQYELGAARTLFKFKKNIAELCAKLADAQRVRMG